MISSPSSRWRLSLRGRRSSSWGFSLLFPHQDAGRLRNHRGIRDRARVDRSRIRSIARGRRLLPRCCSCSRCITLRALRSCFPRLIALAFVMWSSTTETFRDARSIWQPGQRGLALGAARWWSRRRSLFGVLRRSGRHQGAARTRPPRGRQARWSRWSSSGPSQCCSRAMTCCSADAQAWPRLRPVRRSPLAAWQVPASSPRVIVVIVAFASGRRALMGLGLVALAATLGLSLLLARCDAAREIRVAARRGAVLLAARFAARHWIVTRRRRPRHA